MHYFGGKARISKHLCEFLNKQINDGTVFVDMFCGSCNIVSKIKAKTRYANDLHKELISMWKCVQSGGELPSNISEEQYRHIKNNDAPLWLKGFVGFGCSYSGKWWGGYCRDGGTRNYCSNAKNSTLKKMETLQDVIFSNLNYLDFDTSSFNDNTVVYCDIPYKNTTGYCVEAFSHEVFYSWAKCLSDKGVKIFVSEYSQNVPDGWNVVWEKTSKKDIRNKDGVQETTREVLITPVTINK